MRLNVILGATLLVLLFIFLLNLFGRRCWLFADYFLAMATVLVMLFYGQLHQKAEVNRQQISKMSMLGNIASGVGHNLNNRFNSLVTLINMYFLKYGEVQDFTTLSKEELKARQTELIGLLKQIREESCLGFSIAAILSKSAKQPIKPQSFYLEEAVKLAFDLLKLR